MAQAQILWWPKLKDFDGTGSSILMAQAQILWAQTQVFWWLKRKYFGLTLKYFDDPNSNALERMSSWRCPKCCSWRYPDSPHQHGLQVPNNFPHLSHIKRSESKTYIIPNWPPLWMILCQSVNLTTLAVMFDFSSQFTLKFWEWVDSILVDHSKCPFEYIFCRSTN